MSISPQDTMTIAQAGLHLGLSYQQVLRLVMVGQLRGWQTKQGRWQLATSDVTRLASRQRSRSDGKDSR